MVFRWVTPLGPGLVMEARSAILAPTRIPRAKSSCLSRFLPPWLGRHGLSQAWRISAHPVQFPPACPGKKVVVGSLESPSHQACLRADLSTEAAAAGSHPWRPGWQWICPSRLSAGQWDCACTAARVSFPPLVGFSRILAVVGA